MMAARRFNRGLQSDFTYVMRLPINLFIQQLYRELKQDYQYLKCKNKKEMVSLARNTLVSLNQERLVTLNRNQVVSLSEISLVGYNILFAPFCQLLHHIVE
jgi:hypothetical protein